MIPNERSKPSQFLTCPASSFLQFHIIHIERKHDAVNSIRAKILSLSINSLLDLIAWKRRLTAQ